jgi:hypothetical protein
MGAFNLSMLHEGDWILICTMPAAATRANTTRRSIKFQGQAMMGCSDGSMRGSSQLRFCLHLVSEVAKLFNALLSVEKWSPPVTIWQRNYQFYH